MQNIRLRCQAHNQYGAERTFGAGFMSDKREESRRIATEARTHSEARAGGTATAARAQGTDLDSREALAASGGV